MSQRKPYNKEMQQSYDPVARKPALQLLQQVGYDLYDKDTLSTEYYKKGDLKIQDTRSNDPPFMVEVEVKNNWVTYGDWERKFCTVHFLESKINTEAVIWVLFNKDLNTCLITTFPYIRTCTLIKKDAYCEDGTIMRKESYRELDPDKCNLFTLIDNYWVLTQHRMVLT